MPPLSVLIPIRNAEATVDQALGSITSQSFTDWEGILVDDASTDQTPRLLRAWARREPRFTLLANDRPLGIPASLNLALEHASAPLIARMDADDCSLPRRFERQLERLGQGDVAAVGCRVRYFPEGDVRDGADRYAEWLNGLVTPDEHARDLFVECPLAHPTLMARTEILRDLGGYRERGWPEDYDLLLRLWEAGHRMAKVPENLLLWREHAARASRTRPEYSPEAFLRCKAHFLKRTHLADGRPAVVFGAGPVGKAFARTVRGLGVPVRAFVEVDPRKIGQTPYGIPVIDQHACEQLKGQCYGLVAVGQPGARQEIRDLLLAAGWTECEDFRCVA